MVSENTLIRHFKNHIKYIESQGKIFKVNSVMGTLNLNAKLRKWWKARYVSESSYLPFFLERRKHFIYDPSTGQITTNDNPFKKPVVFDVMLQSDGMKEAMKNVNKIYLLIELFKYLKVEVRTAPTADAAAHNMFVGERMRGETGVQLQELLLTMANLDPNPLVFLTDEDAEHPNEFKTFVREFKGVLNLRGPNVFFDDCVIHMAEEVEEDIQKLAKDAVKQLITAFLKEDVSGTKRYPLRDVATFLNQKVGFLSLTVVNGQQYDQLSIRDLLENDERFHIVKRSTNSFDLMLANTSRMKEIPPSRQLCEKSGEFLTNVKGKVAKVRQEKIVFETESEFGRVLFICKDNDSSLVRRLHCGDEVSFFGRYNKDEDLWEATRILLITHTQLPLLEIPQKEGEDGDDIWSGQTPVVDAWDDVPVKVQPSHEFDCENKCLLKTAERNLENLSIADKAESMKKSENVNNRVIV